MSEQDVSEPLPPPSVAICILGMHRGGTSAVAGMLYLLGVDLGRQADVATTPNSRASWEYKQIVTCQTRMLDALGSCSEDFLPLPAGWEKTTAAQPHRDYLLALLRAEFAGRPIWGVKDPRTCRTLPVWHDLFRTIQVEPRFVLVVRSPDAVGKSMSAGTGCPYNQSLLLWLAHMLEAERQTRDCRRSIVVYRELIADWRQHAVRIGAELGIEWPLSPQNVSDEAAGLPNLLTRRHTADESLTAPQAAQQYGADERLAGWAFEAYHQLTTSVQSEAMDRIGREFREAAPGLAGWRPRRMIGVNLNAARPAGAPG